MGTMSYVEQFERDEYCECGSRIASDGACENENHDDAAEPTAVVPDEAARAARSAEIMARATGSVGCTYVVQHRALDGTLTEVARATYDRYVDEDGRYRCPTCGTNHPTRAFAEGCAHR